MKEHLPSILLLALVGAPLVGVVYLVIRGIGLRLLRRMGGPTKEFRILEATKVNGGVFYRVQLRGWDDSEWRAADYSSTLEGACAILAELQKREAAIAGNKVVSSRVVE